MADQVVDKLTVGIPADIEVVRNDTDKFRQEASDSADAAASSAKSAQASQAAAAESALEAAQSAASQSGITTLASEIPREARRDGLLWLVWDASSKSFTAMKRWDASNTDNVSYPSETSYPSESSHPEDPGAWEDATFASALIKS